MATDQQEGGSAFAASIVGSLAVPAVDNIAPVPGNQGLLRAFNQSRTAMTLSWAAASDETSPSLRLVYEVYRSESGSMGTPADMRAHGVMVAADLRGRSDVNFSVPDDGKDYHYNVIVMDEAGNRAAYQAVRVAPVQVPDTQAPAPGNGGLLGVTGISATALTVNWTSAADDTTNSLNLEYRVYFSTTANISTAAAMEANGTPVGAFASAISSLTINSLAPSTTYYFNVMVRDAAGNRAAYTMTGRSTSAIPDTAPPVVGNGGNLITSSVSTNSLTLSWTAAADNTDAHSSLRYSVYRSTSPNVNNVALMETNGTLVAGPLTGATSVNITGLNAASQYYFNVLVSDAAGNKAYYQMRSQTTALPPDNVVPAPGNNGLIVVSNISTTSLTLAWTQATDNLTPQNSLLYRVYRAPTGVLTSVAAVESQGIPLNNYQLGISSLNVTGLTPSTRYYFNVIVRDTAGNKSVYALNTAVTNAPPDVTAPVPGASGALAASNISAQAMTILWNAASDAGTNAAGLRYRVYYSTSADIATVAGIEANGVPAGAYQAAIENLHVTGLNPETTYYFNVIVQDVAGNKSAYNMINRTTPAIPDTTSPVPGSSGTLFINNVSATSLTLTWTRATDNVTVQPGLEYLVYRSESANIATVSDAEANGMPVGAYAADPGSLDLTGLNASTTYYFNVLVRDAAGNKAAYTMATQTTPAPPDVTAPTPGNSGSLTVGNVTGTAFTLSWSKASDDVTAQGGLSYRAYYSLSDALNSVVDVESNGTAVGPYASDIEMVNVSGLEDDRTYYVNVIVRDAAGNKALYTRASATTPKLPDTTPPVRGSHGVYRTTASSSSLGLQWSRATDDETAQNALEYRLYRSDSANISTVAEMETNGTPMGPFVADQIELTVSGLNDATVYYFNTIVRDAAGNKAAYRMAAATTSDGTPPVPGNGGTLTTSNLNTSQFIVRWDEAVDNTGAPASLKYRVYVSSLPNITTVQDVLANGTPLNTNFVSYPGYHYLTNLESNTTYYVNVLVRDYSNNVAAYNMVTYTTTVNRLDMSFNGSTGIARGPGAHPAANLLGHPTHLALQADGKILIAGPRGGMGFSNDMDFALMRLRTNGRTDLFSGTDGTAQTNLHSYREHNDVPTAVIVQPDQKILVGGYTFHGAPPLSSPEYQNFGLVRYNSSGSLDSSFGNNGKLDTDIQGRDDIAHAMILRPDGRIVLGGSSDNGYRHDYAMVGYNSDGSLDTTFGTGGKLNVDFGPGHDVIRQMALQSDGKIVAAVSVSDNHRVTPINQMVIMRFNADGSPDTSFATGGSYLSPRPGHVVSFALKVLGDGRILVFYQSYDGYELMRMTPTGAVDTSFGTNGFFLVSTSSSSNATRWEQGGLGFQADGKIILSMGYGLYRLHPNGGLDLSFDMDGYAQTDHHQLTGSVRDLLIQPDGGILVVTSPTFGDGSSKIVRYYPEP